MKPYVGRVQVRFGDVDRAGIVYYPRIFDYFHQVFEGFFEERVRIPYPDVIQRMRAGFPAVHYEVDFLSPLKYGDKLPVRFSVARIGRSSVTFRYEIFRGKKQLVKALGTTVRSTKVNAPSFTWKRTIGTELPIRFPSWVCWRID